MADEIIIKVTLDTRDVQRAAKDIQNQLNSAFQTGGSGAQNLKKQIDETTAGVNSLKSAFNDLKSTLLTLGAITLFENIARKSVESAIAIDRQVNVLKALTGSAEAAKQRFAELIAIAEKTPGLTTNLAATLDTQLRILNVTEQTINRLLPVIGRLNAIAPIQDPTRFTQNIGQLITGNFRVQDLRELVNNAPLAGQLIKQIFNVDSPVNAKAIRDAAQKLGIRTTEELIKAFTEAGEKNPILQGVTESLGTQLSKLQNDLNVALAPIGEEILKTILPLFKEIVEFTKKYGVTARDVFRENRVDILATATSITQLIGQIGQLITVIFNLGNAKSGFAGIKQEFQDLASIFAFLTDLSEGNLETRPRTKALAEQQRDIFQQSGARAPLLVRRSASGKFNPINNQDQSSRLGAADNARNQQRALREAQFAFTKQIAEDDLKIVKDINDRGIQQLKDAYDQNKITLREFFEFKKNLEVDSLDANLRILDQEAAALTENLKKAKGPEAIRDQAKLNNVLTEELLIRNKILDTVEATTREFEQSAKLQPLTLEQVKALEVKVIDPAAKAREERGFELRRQVQQGAAAEIELRREELQIQDQVNRGVLTEGEARKATLELQRQFRDVLLAGLKAQDARTLDPEEIAKIRLQVDEVSRLGVEFSNAERFARGFNSAIGTVGDAFDRFGQNVSRALTNVKDLFNGLKQAVLSFFNDLIGQSLQNLVRQTLGPLLGSVGGIGGIGGGGNLFRTPSFAGGLAQAFAGAGGGVPPSVTGTQQVQQVLDEIAGPATRPRTVTGAIGGAATTAARGGFSFGGLLGNLASSAPLIGLGLGSGLGGQSGLGQILGAGAGAALGLGISFGASVFGAGGGLAAASLAALGPAALIAAPLAIGAIFLGRAAQRRKDEEASGQFLTEALNSISQLKAGVASDQIDGAQARTIFETQIIAKFDQQIRTLKTKSVRDSRLKNQVADLRKVFEDSVAPEITAQQTRRTNQQRFGAIDSRLVPQFTTGGIVPGIDRGRDSVLALLTPGEVVLNQSQQASVLRDGGPQVFSRAGLPTAGVSVGPAQAFQLGGIAQPISFGSGSSAPIAINLSVELGMTESDTQQIVARATNSRTGENIVLNVIDRARTRNRRV